MATYKPSQVGVQAPEGGFQEGGWYGGRQYWGGTLSDPGVVHPSSNQQGAGQAVSEEVNRQSAEQQGVSYDQFSGYLNQQRQQSSGVTPQQISSAGQTSMPGSGTGVGINQPETLNLPDLYDQLYESAGIKGLEGELQEKERIKTETLGKINDNPYLSEATRVGRIAKVEQLHQDRTKNLRDEIATKKADVETKLNLESKQFDINSQVAQQNLDRFNTLLQLGALSNASGEDIANLTRSTGLSSQAIQSAISAQNKRDRNTQVITSTADSGEVTATVVDTQTGEIVSQNSLGQIGNRQTSGGGGSQASLGSSEYTANLRSLASQDLQENANSYGHVSPQYWSQLMNLYIQGGGTREDFIENFSNYADYNRGDFREAYGFENPTLAF